MAAAARAGPRIAYPAFAAAAIMHALVVVLLWVAALYFDRSFVPGRVWLVVAWLWLIWPAVLSLHPARSPLRVLVPCLVGLALLAPCVPTIWSFTTWAIGGFAL